MINVFRAMLVAALLACPFVCVPLAANDDAVTPMQGIPPTRESQVTMANYRDYPMSMWAFRNAGAVLNTVMIPREGDIRALFDGRDRCRKAGRAGADYGQIVPILALVVRRAAIGHIRHFTLLK